jgi:hypothetical protein
MIRAQVVQPINEILFSVDYMGSTYFLYAIPVKLYAVSSADSVRNNAVVFNSMDPSEAGERKKYLSQSAQRSQR